MFLLQVFFEMLLIVEIYIHTTLKLILKKFTNPYLIPPSPYLIF